MEDQELPLTGYFLQLNLEKTFALECVLVAVVESSHCSSRGGQEQGEEEAIGILLLLTRKKQWDALSEPSKLHPTRSTNVVPGRAAALGSREAGGDEATARGQGAALASCKKLIFDFPSQAKANARGQGTSPGVEARARHGANPDVNPWHHPGFSELCPESAPDSQEEALSTSGPRQEQSRPARAPGRLEAKSVQRRQEREQQSTAGV